MLSSEAKQGQASPEGERVAEGLKGPSKKHHEISDPVLLALDIPYAHTEPFSREASMPQPSVLFCSDADLFRKVCPVHGMLGLQTG